MFGAFQTHIYYSHSDKAGPICIPFAKHLHRCQQDNKSEGVRNLQIPNRSWSRKHSHKLSLISFVSFCFFLCVYSGPMECYFGRYFHLEPTHTRVFKTLMLASIWRMDVDLINPQWHPQKCELPFASSYFDKLLWGNCINANFLFFLFLTGMKSCWDVGKLIQRKDPLSAELFQSWK